jgi:hypothetical protein
MQTPLTGIALKLLTDDPNTVTPPYVDLRSLGKQGQILHDMLEKQGLLRTPKPVPKAVVEPPPTWPHLEPRHSWREPLGQREAGDHQPLNPDMREDEAQRAAHLKAHGFPVPEHPPNNVPNLSANHLHILPETRNVPRDNWNAHDAMLEPAANFGNLPKLGENGGDKVPVDGGSVLLALNKSFPDLPRDERDGAMERAVNVPSFEEALELAGEEAALGIGWKERKEKGLGIQHDQQLPLDQLQPEQQRAHVPQASPQPLELSAQEKARAGQIQKAYPYQQHQHQSQGRGRSSGGLGESEWCVYSGG